MPDTPDNEINIQQAVPFFRVADIDASIHYYVKGLGFTIADKWMDDGKIRWCWLQRDAAALMLQEFWKEGRHLNIPSEKTGIGVSICFICKNAIALYKEFMAKGIAASKPFVGNNMWVTSLKDPDGYNLHFESNTDIPEETEYDEAQHS